MSQGIVEAGDWLVCGAMFLSTVGGGERFQSRWMLSLFPVVSLVVGDWRNFGSNCASAICIRNFLGEN